MLALKAFASIIAKASLAIILKLMTEEFIKWAILRLAKQYVQSTETSVDDEWYQAIEEMVEFGHIPKG